MRCAPHADTPALTGTTTTTGNSPQHRGPTRYAITIRRLAKTGQSFRTVCQLPDHRSLSLAVTSNRYPPGLDTSMPESLAAATEDRLLHDTHDVLTRGGTTPRLAQAIAGHGVTPPDLTRLTGPPTRPTDHQLRHPPGAHREIRYPPARTPIDRLHGDASGP